MGKIVLYMPLSKDNCIYAKDGNLDWLPGENVMDENDSFGYKAFIDRVKYIFMGSKTYENTLKMGDWLWKDQTTYVFTSNKSLVKENSDKINFVHDDIATFMSGFKGDGDVWLFGGGKLATSFDKLNLVDEIIFTQIPVVLDGIKLDIQFDNYTLKESKDLGNDNHVKHYVKK